MTIIYFVGGSLDLLFGFNQTDGGLSTLLILFVSAPLLNLAWLVIETIRAVKIFRHHNKIKIVLLPIAALLLLVESVAIDLYILSQVRM